jgi:hypothetical protein
MLAALEIHEARNRRYGVLPGRGWEGRHVRNVILRSERARLTVRVLVPLLVSGLPGLSRSGRYHLPDVRIGLPDDAIPSGRWELSFRPIAVAACQCLERS